MKFFLFLTGIVLLFFGGVPAFSAENPFLSEEKQQDFIFQEKDLYKKIYDQLGKDFSEGAVTNSRKTLDRVSSMIGVAPEQYLSAIQGKTPSALAICGIRETDKKIISSDEAIACQGKLEQLFSEEYSRNSFEWRLQYDALAREAWMNGSLLDGSFDLVVDLNVIDFILFGKNATVPSAPSPLWYDGDANNNSGGNDSSIPGEESPRSDDTDEGSQSGDKKTSPSPSPSSDSDQTGQICIDPDALFFEKEENSERINTQNAIQKRKDLQSGALFESGEYGYLGGTYLDFAELANEEDEECDGDELPIFGGRVCVPKFCNDIMCIKITFLPGYRAVSNKQKLDCVECSVQRGLEVVRKLYGLPGKLAPNDSPTRNFFLTAFSNLFRNITSSVTIISKPLPFLVYKTQNDPPPITKNYEGEPPSQTPSVEEEKEEREKSYYDQNKDLFEILDQQNCESKLAAVRGDGIQSEIIDECKKDMDFLGYSLEYLQSPLDTSGRSVAEALESEQARSSFYNDVVVPYFSQLEHSMGMINDHFLQIQSVRLLENVSSCKTRV
jgi:hypothetical protein